jgi:hypothetical protein
LGWGGENSIIQGIALRGIGTVVIEKIVIEKIEFRFGFGQGQWQGIPHRLGTFHNHRIPIRGIGLQPLWPRGCLSLSLGLHSSHPTFGPPPSRRLGLLANHHTAKGANPH